MKFLFAILLLFFAAPARAATTWDGVYSADQAARGAALYADRCAECHGGTMEGSMNAPPLAGIAFAYVWDGMKLSELFNFTRTTMPPNQVGTVSDAQMADILAAVLAANAFPAGETAL